jgi:hypothetical protein
MKIKMIATMLITFSVMLSTAQNFSLQAKSGDVELDASLNDINVKAKLDLPLFKKDLAVEFNIGEPKIDKLIVDMKMSPADAYMTLQVANMTKKEPDVVAQSYSVNKDKGWGVIAKEMGIKPGSPEFHALKGKAKGKKDKGNKGESGNGNGNGNSKGNSKGKKK